MSGHVKTSMHNLELHYAFAKVLISRNANLSEILADIGKRQQPLNLEKGNTKTPACYFFFRRKQMHPALRVKQKFHDK